MSRKDEYLAKADEVAVQADRCNDPTTKETLLCAAKSWRLLAELEDRDWPSTRWPLGPDAAS